ncbi:uncharacterized protein Fot_23060 [Forsythia ovata]|uniref:Uncharacterized protein n=1 Tax=Forsythia ovata TaxID=205694 RepID=A0ABD1UZG1_9LAMI
MAGRSHRPGGCMGHIPYQDMGQAAYSTEDAIKDLCSRRPVSSIVVLADLLSKDKQLDAKEQGTGYGSGASSSNMISFEPSSGSPSEDHTPASIDDDKYVEYHLDNAAESQAM